MLELRDITILTLNINNVILLFCYPVNFCQLEIHYDIINYFSILLLVDQVKYGSRAIHDDYQFPPFFSQITLLILQLDHYIIIFVDKRSNLYLLRDKVVIMKKSLRPGRQDWDQCEFEVDVELIIGILIIVTSYYVFFLRIKG